MNNTKINLKLAFPLSFISMLFFPSAIWMFFYLQHLSFAEIATIMGIGAITSIVLEVPTGVFADVVGRKWAVAISYFLFAIAMVGVAYSTTFWAFLVWTIANTLVNALYSGSMEALLYDTLKQSGREAEFDHWTSRMESATWLGLFVSAVTGGYMYAIDPRLPYFAQTTVTLLAGFLALGLIEPQIDSNKFKWIALITKNVAGVKELISTPKLRYLTAVCAIVGVGYYVAADILGISQAKEYGLNPETVGWVFGTGYIISAVASHYYPTLNKRFGERHLLSGAAIVLVLSLLLAKNAGLWMGIGLIIARIASSTTFRNSRSVIMNKEIASKNRATSLSTLNLFTMLPYALTASLIGTYIDKTSPNQFAWVLGWVIVGLLGLTLVLRARSMRERI